MPSLVIDRRFASIGRLKKATGTDDARMHALYVGMCEHFDAAGAVEWLEALKRGPSKGGITFAQAYRYFKPTKGRTLDITRLPSPETVQRLWEVEDGAEVGALRRWLDALDCSAAHRANIARDLRGLRALASDTATVADLPDLLKRARTAAVKRQRRRSFNMLRQSALAFLRDTVGVRHALYFAVQDTKPLDEQRKPTTGLPLEGVHAVSAALRDAAARTGDALAHAWWLLCTTGMRPAELWQEGGASWTLHVDHVYVFASKTDTGRKIPIVDAAALARPLTASRASLRNLLWALTTGKLQYAGRGAWPVPVSLYTGRRTFRHACDMAGVPDSRGSYYRSAKPATVDQRYLQHDVTPYLAADAAKLRQWFGLGDDGRAPLTLVTERSA